MTTKKYLTNEGTVESFFRNEYENGYAYGERNSNIFYRGNKLYSYGYHFILAQIEGMYTFSNADVYSSSTSKHQSYVRRFMPKLFTIEIPFSALESADIVISGIEVIDKEASKYIEIERRVDGETKLVEMHLMGSTLFKYDGRYFLSGIDETAKDLWKGFFLTELVAKCETVKEAYECLKPETVKRFESIGVEHLRQGEYFFRPLQSAGLEKELNKLARKGEVKKNERLKHATADKNIQDKWQYENSRHVVTNYIEIEGQVYAKGTCRHVAGEHRMLKLPTWHSVHENVQVQSWASEGKVD